MHQHQFAIEVAAPFRLDLTVWVLRRRAHNLVDAWDGATYRRLMNVHEHSREVEVRQRADRAVPTLLVDVHETNPKDAGAVETEVRRILDRTLGLSVELAGFYELAKRDERLSDLANQFRGMRPARFASVFEALVNAVACQQLSLTVGIHLLNRLSERYASVGQGAQGEIRGFVSPRELAAADVAGIRALGFSNIKARVLIDIARRVTEGELDLESLDDLDDARAGALLGGLAGIGRWSTEYVLLRGLGRLNVLPGDDVGARNNLQRRSAVGESADYAALSALSHSWRPYGGLVYFHLLLDALAGEGLVARTP